MSLAPIVILTYKRAEHLQKTLEAIRQNALAAESDLIVYSDGPKYPDNEADVAAINAVREVVKSKQWCKNVKLVAGEKNKGLNDAFFDGITEVMNEYGKAIILEEDIVVSPHFLDYMNDALNMYEHEKKVFQITGYIFNMKTQHLPSTYFMTHPFTWGWATWKDRWEKLIPDAKELMQVLVDNNHYKRLTFNGSELDFWEQMQANAEGRMNTWDIKWFCSVVANEGLCLFPQFSLVKNIGFDGSGAHFQNGDMGLDTNMYAKKIVLQKQIIAENAAAQKSLIKFFKSIKPGIFQRIKEKFSITFSGKRTS